MSSTLIESQSPLSPLGHPVPESSRGGTPLLTEVPSSTGGDRPAHSNDEKHVSVVISKGLAPAPNGMNPLPITGRVQAVASTTSEPPAAAVQSAELTTTATDPVSSDASAAIDAQVAVPQGATEEAVVAPVATPVEGASNVVAEATESSPAPPPSGGGEAGVSALDGVGALAEMEAMKEALGEPGGNAAAIDEERASTNSLKDDPGTPEECNLFVGDLARNLTEEKLEKAFQQHGRVMSVSIKRDRATGKNLGYGFVKMSSHQEARTAKEAMQNVELGGRRVRVGWAQKNTSLCVSGLEPGITIQMLVAEFGRYGPLDKELTTIKPEAKCGFVKYRYRQHAETAKKELNNRPAFGGQCSNLQIEWNSVESKAEESEAGGSTDGNASERHSGTEAPAAPSSSSIRSSGNSEGSAANSVHVQFEGEQSAVSGVNEAMIKKMFAQWEPIVDVVIPASRYNGVSPGPRQLPRCWGFVHFPPTPEGERAAKDAIQALKGTTISGMKVHCTMSRSSSGSGWRKHSTMGVGERGGRSRRSSIDRGGDDHGRQMMHHVGQSFGGRQGRPSMDSQMAPGRGGWGMNAGMRHNVPMHHRHQFPLSHPLHPAHHVPHNMPHHPAAHDAPHHMQPPHAGLHPHPQHPHQPHQQPQQHQMFGYAAGAGGAAAGAATAYPGQYPVAAATGHPVAAEGAAGAAGATGEMMVQTPYGMTPYPYMFQGVPFAPAAQQGYQMTYQQMYGYPFQAAAMAMDPSMMQGQATGAAGVQQQASGASGPQQAQPTPMHQTPGQGQAEVASGQMAAPLSQQQQQAQQVAQHMGAQRPPSQLQAQQQQQQQQHMAQARAAQRHMGMQHHLIMSGGGNPAAAHGLNVGVPSYLPMYQLPQMPPAGAPGVGDASGDPSEAGKHGE